ncbi:hypothetical protein [Klebsiella pneumoniae]
MGEISVKTGNNARNGGKNSLNRLIRCVCGKKIGPDPRNFNQRVSLGRNDLLIRTFPNGPITAAIAGMPISISYARHLGSTCEEVSAQRQRLKHEREEQVQALSYFYE